MVSASIRRRHSDASAFATSGTCMPSATSLSASLSSEGLSHVADRTYGVGSLSHAADKSTGRANVSFEMLNDLVERSLYRSSAGIHLARPCIATTYAGDAQGPADEPH